MYESSIETASLCAARSDMLLHGSEIQSLVDDRDINGL